MNEQGYETFHHSKYHETVSRYLNDRESVTHEEINACAESASLALYECRKTHQWVGEECEISLAICCAADAASEAEDLLTRYYGQLAIAKSNFGQYNRLVEESKL